MTNDDHTDTAARPNPEPYGRVVNGFKRLEYQRMLKAITEIDDFLNGKGKPPRGSERVAHAFAALNEAQRLKAITAIDDFWNKL